MRIVWLLYRAYRTACHGDAGQGASGTELARAWESIRPDLTLRATVAQGVPGTAMTGWARAQSGPRADPEKDDIVAWLLTLALRRPSRSTQNRRPPQRRLRPGRAGQGLRCCWER